MEIRILEALPDEPPYYLAVASIDSVNKNDMMRGYAADISLESAKLRAQWECYERVALYNYTELSQTLSIKGTPKDLGSDAIPINAFAGGRYHKNTVLDQNCQSTIREWVEVSNYATKKIKYAPVETVALRISPEPAIPIREPITTGVAAHRDYNSCIHAALLEIIERDAFMRAHLGLTNPTCLKVDTSIKKLFHQLRKYRLECKIYSLPSVIAEVTVLLAVIIDKSGFGPALTSGMAAGYDASALTKKAVLEAWQPRSWLRGAYKKALLNQENDSICTQLDRGMYWWSLKKLKKLEKLIAINQKTKLSDLNQQELSVTQLTDRLLNKEYSIYIAKLSENGTDMGHVCRMLIPGLFPLFLNESFNYLSPNSNSVFPKIHFFL